MLKDIRYQLNDEHPYFWMKSIPQDAIKIGTQTNLQASVYIRDLQELKYYKTKVLLMMAYKNCFQQCFSAAAVKTFHHFSFFLP